MRLEVVREAREVEAPGGELPLRHLLARRQRDRTQRGIRYHQETKRQLPLPFFSLP